MTAFRLGLALTGCLLLSGCFLMSETPRFDDGQAVALFGSETTDFAHFDLDGGEWKPSDMPLVTMIPVGGHYLLHDPSGPETTEDDPILHVVSLDDGHWLLQMSAPESEQEKSAYYAVATWDGHELLAHPIACDDLRDRKGIAALVNFSGDDCSLLPQPAAEAPDFPALLWQDLPPADTRLVLQP